MALTKAVSGNSIINGGDSTINLGNNSFLYPQSNPQILASVPSFYDPTASATPPYGTHVQYIMSGPPAFEAAVADEPAPEDEEYEDA